MLLVLKLEERAKECKWPFEAWKDKEMDYSLEPQEEHSLAAPFHTSGLQQENTTNMCSSMPLNVWQSITSAIEGKTVNNITVNNIAVTALQSPSSRVLAQGQLCQQIFQNCSIRPRGLKPV